jgi:Domain of unknown function (DUF4249)
MAIKRTIPGLLILLIGVFFSCEEEANIPFHSENTNLLAVEGIVTNENINHVIRLTLPYQKQNGRSIPVNNATVSISDGTSSIVLTPADSGRYRTPKMRFVSGRTYSLTITFNGKQYSAQDSSVPVESLSPFSFANAPGGYHINFFDTGSQPNYIEYAIDWTDTPSCISECKARILYYDLKTVDANELFKPEKTDFVFPPQSTIIRRKFSTSDEYRAYLRSMLSETQWRGSVFDVQRDNAPTNLSEGAIGFFAVSTVVSDTLRIQ